MKNRTRDSRSGTRKPVCPALSKWSRPVTDDRSGMALLVVVLILAIILVLGAATLTLATGAKRMVIMQDHRTQAYYIADAGVERALAMLRADPDWRDPCTCACTGTCACACTCVCTCSGTVCNGGLHLAGEYPDTNSEGKVVQVSVKDAANQPAFGQRVQIISEGHFRGVGAPGHAQEKLAVNVRVASVADLLGGISILPPEPIDLELEASAGIGNGSVGNLILNGNLTLEGGASIEANVHVSGIVSGIVTGIGGAVPNYPFIPSFPVFDEQWLKEQAIQSGTFFEDTSFVIGEPSDSNNGGEEPDLNITALASGGIYFIDGNVTISGGYSVPAIIVATGNITIGTDTDEDLERGEGGNGVPIDERLLTLIAFGSKSGTAGDVSMVDSWTEALIIAHGAFNAPEGASMFGGIIAQGLGDRGPAGSNSFTLGDSLSVDVPPSGIIKDSLPPAIIPPSSLIIESWKEA